MFPAFLEFGSFFLILYVVNKSNKSYLTQLISPNWFFQIFATFWNARLESKVKDADLCLVRG
jgi:hypothetical protein